MLNVDGLLTGINYIFVMPWKKMIRARKQKRKNNFDEDGNISH
jgi:hypothetical protein